MSSQSKWIASIQAIIEGEGAECVSCETAGGGHLRFTVAHQGATRKLFASMTPSDHRALANVRRDVRKVMREMAQVAPQQRHPEESTRP